MTYQWIATSVGGSSYSASQADTLCGSSAQTSECIFPTSGSTALGTYSFELNATDPNGVNATSGPASVTVAVATTTSTTSTVSTTSTIPAPKYNVDVTGCAYGNAATYVVSGTVLQLNRSFGVTFSCNGNPLVSWQGSGAGSYTGPANTTGGGIPTITVLGDIIETATYQSGTTTSVTTIPTTTVSANTSYSLTVSPSNCAGVSLSSATGYYPAGTSLTIFGYQTCNGKKFSSWSGSGSGSYTGTSINATITMNGGISETAIFTTASSSVTTVPTTIVYNSTTLHTTSTVRAGNIISTTAKSTSSTTVAVNSTTSILVSHNAQTNPISNFFSGIINWFKHLFGSG